MKKIIYYLAAFIFGISSANANIVALGTAQTVAANYYKLNTQKEVSSVTLAYTEKSPTGDPVYYVFNINGKEGFIIISAEDAGHPVIGYSTEGNYVVPSATSNTEFNFWMGKRKTEILDMRAQNVQANSEVSTEWTNYLSGKFNSQKIMSAVNAPLVQSTWDQDGGGTIGYNALCPGGSVTGCVATTMAQIMRYWGYPSKGTGSSSYTQSPNPNSYPQQSANYGNTTYNWGNMPLDVSNGDVALIMYQCGVSVDMNYDPKESGANVCGSNPSAIYSYQKYFKYDPAINCVTQSNYSTANWISILEAQFAAGRPVQYEGTDAKAGGHTWVCDGNDASDNMHMNWGWSGAADGYYAVTNLAPTGQGYDFSMYDAAIIDIKPIVSAALDAGVFSIASPTGTTCNTTLTPVVTIKNFGTTTLTSCTIKCNVDNNSNSTYNWTGSLSSYQSINDTLPAITVSTGSHTFTCATSMPNGSTDSNTSNDQLQSSVNVLADVASQQVPYIQGFENSGFPYADCFLESTNSTQWNTTTNAAFSGTASMELNAFSQTLPGVYGFITPSIDLSSLPNYPILTFEVAHAQRTSKDADELAVLTSSSCKANWISRHTWSETKLASAGVVSSAFTPSSQSQWTKETVNLESIKGQTDVRIKFEFTSYGAGNNVYIDDINISDVAAGVPEEFENGFSFNVFPNPFSRNTTISFDLPQSKNVSISLYDIVGREVLPISVAKEFSAGTYTLPLNGSDLKSGIYFVKLNVDGYSVVKKVIIE